MIMFNFDVVIVAIIAYFLVQLIKKYKKHIFAFVMAKMTKKSNQKLKVYKEEIFQTLTEEAKQAGKHNLKVLEIGGGSGSNFEFVKFPVDWTVSEPNKCFAPYFKQTVDELGGEHKIGELVEAVGENLSQFESNSFDAVIVTLVLCSVNDVDATLSEIRRVLRPGRSLFLLEHVAAPRGTFLRWLQDRLTESGFWPTMCDGCHVNKETEAALTRAEFGGGSQMNTKSITNSIVMYVSSVLLYGKITK